MMGPAYSKNDQSARGSLKENENSDGRIPLRLVRRQRNILVIDDDVDTAKAIKYLAEIYSPGSQVQVIHDPYEAMLALADREYDLVLVDEKIPGLNGSTLLTQIDSFIDEDPTILESLRYVNKVPVVLMSGSADLSGIHCNYRNFSVEERLKKRELPGFLSRTFSI